MNSVLTGSPMTSSPSARSTEPARPTGLPVVVGHRGAAAIEPENTIVSFRRGAADGSAWLECDVHLSADGHDVVIHDATIDRTAQADSPRRTGAVAELTRAELDEVLVGSDQHIPTLAEVLEACVREDGTRIPLLIEIKAPAAATRVIEVLRETFTEEDWGADVPPAVALSFHVEPLEEVSRELPQVPLMRTTTATSEEFWQSVERLQMAMVGVRISDARQQDVERARALGVELNLWTAVQPEQIERALELGCESITADDPAWALELIRSSRAQER